MTEAGGAPRHKTLEPWNDPGQSPYIQIAGVSKRFGAFTAVDNVSVDIF